MKHPNFRQQQGSTLIVAMIFLLVLTLAGVTAMRFASLEENMAGNSQASGYIFQQVQSEIQQEIRALNKASGRNYLNGLDYKSKMGTVTVADQKFMPVTASDLINIPGTSQGTGRFVQNIADKNIRFVRDGACGDGSSISSFICIDFELDTTGTTGAGASSKQAQGFTFKNNVASD